MERPPPNLAQTPINNLHTCCWRVCPAVAKIALSQLRSQICLESARLEKGFLSVLLVGGCDWPANAHGTMLFRCARFNYDDSARPLICTTPASSSLFSSYPLSLSDRHALNAE